MTRIDRDRLGLALASAWALRSTCARKAVGCVLWDGDGHEVGTGYNGPASGQPHCGEKILKQLYGAPGAMWGMPGVVSVSVGEVYHCPGAGLPSGTGLDKCEAIHAEANALLRCRDVRQIQTAYVTHSPCIHCVKLLMNTACRRIAFIHPYAHDEAARALWEQGGRAWDRVAFEPVVLG